ncbi:unnamed protein product [Porites evermanni]|uniref:SGNH hydrolase-type esterase domain-containing protein n=1 Tax=Porites evermanni TaxID=104178 RepID=A0ABN8Q9Q5_9CNID|nr:unnamed protein product [Porites evermanni]
MNLAHENVSFLGIGGRTVSKMLSFDFDKIKAFQPKVIILELGTNYLCVVGQRPESVGSDIEHLVQVLHDYCGAELIMVCLVIYRPSIAVLCRDGVHLNQAGNYALYHYLLNGFQHGFLLDYVGPHKPSSCKNLLSATQNPAAAADKLSKELSLGRIAGLFFERPFPSLRISPLVLIPQKTPGEFSPYSPPIFSSR